MIRNQIVEILTVALVLADTQTDGKSLDDSNLTMAIALSSFAAGVAWAAGKTMEEMSPFGVEAIAMMQELPK